MKFDAFNYYKSGNVSLIVGIDFDYILTAFYSKCRLFCFNIECIQNKIVRYNSQGDYEFVEKEWNEIDNEFEKFLAAFRKFTSTVPRDLQYVKYYGIKEMGWLDWHIRKKREIRIIFIEDPKSRNESREFDEY